ncbi:uncharacterized protein with LGFP repeats [Okibacterium sp. HSC-33S16]|uniref:LGFP repeat-containing protein n=1 Tax=Okibacterium sp. HSC-33S16 TaxID=2910965 RepID=UPI0020A0F390|nr:hypothetical protein [Okibacterium sp. HSC-33S16]MCP2030508.1 uncharacterized protein with LGFP repeats [Okibacterium sp. HSC-33S16]
MIAVVLATGAVLSARADAPVFNAGNIIDDAVFYNAQSMTESEIQNFLDDKGSACEATDCLRAATFATTPRPADAMCSRYNGGSRESAARIISSVATACGINPQVLLVLMEKEQGLVTTTRPTERKYTIAMGYGCPDTAPCDSEYFGFFNQVYKSASQFIRYTNPEGTSKAFTQYAPGKRVAIRWSPTASCGSSEVHIENMATASLYTYTPYQPNAAALAAGTGTGDACSAYGNRNFFNLFTTWFGSVRAGSTPVAQRGPLRFSTAPELSQAADGLGVATSEVLTYTDGGIGQAFTSGWAYWEKSTDTATATTGDLGEAYNLTGGPAGFLGYPASPAKEHSQTFRNGVLYSSTETGVRFVLRDFHSALTTAGGVSGPLGYPTTNTQTQGDQSSQSFEHGWLHRASADGEIIAVTGAIGDLYVVENGPSGVLGAPLAPASVLSTGLTQQEFENGIAIHTPEQGAQYLLTAAANVYGERGGAAGSLGSPAGSTVTYKNGTIGQKFSNGWLFISRRTGIHQTTGTIGETYERLGGPDSALGSPTDAADTASGVTRQPFKNGAIIQVGDTAHMVLDRVIALYDKTSETLGAPVTDTTTYPSGKSGQQFERGFIYVSQADGARIVSGLIATRYAELGGPDGQLGMPTGDVRTVDGRGQSQQFKNGVLYSSLTGGTHVMTAEFAVQHRRLGGGLSELGHPTGDTVSHEDGTVTQTFQRGELRWTSQDGFEVLSRPISRG